MRFVCEEVLVSYVVRIYDDEGGFENEYVTQQKKLGRNKKTADFWGDSDKVAEEAKRQYQSGMLAGQTKENA